MNTLASIECVASGPPVLRFFPVLVVRTVQESLKTYHGLKDIIELLDS
jgi:hypothetical protein